MYIKKLINKEDFINTYKGRYDPAVMYTYVIEQDRLRYRNGIFYIYLPSQRYWPPIDNGKEWAIIGLFFPQCLRDIIDPDDIADLLKKLRNTFELIADDGDFNINPNLIHCINGAVDYKAQTIVNSDKRHKFDYKFNAKYLPKATIDDAPFFKRFCETSLDGDEQKVKLLLSIIGYLLFPLNNAKKAFVLLGPPNCGKSIICKLVEAIFGENNVCHIPLEKLGDRFSKAMLSLNRINICAELSGKPYRDLETFKLVVGGDSLTAEFKGRTPFDFKCNCKLLFAGNVLPSIKNEDISTAFADRLTVLMFPRSIDEKDRIRDLEEKLLSEKDIIFSLAVNSIKPLIENNMVFDCPEDSANLLKDYSFQQSHIKDFVEEYCDVGFDKSVYSSELYKAYKSFCEDNLVRPISHGIFSQSIGSIAGVQNCQLRIKDSGNRSGRGFTGIALKNSRTQDSDVLHTESKTKNLPLQTKQDKQNGGKQNGDTKHIRQT